MYVCLCHAVNERTIREVARAVPGCTRRDVKRLTGAGTGCGMCVPDIDRLLADERAAAAVVVATQVAAK